MPVYVMNVLNSLDPVNLITGDYWNGLIKDWNEKCRDNVPSQANKLFDKYVSKPDRITLAKLSDFLKKKWVENKQPWIIINHYLAREYAQENFFESLYADDDVNTFSEVYLMPNPNGLNSILGREYVKDNYNYISELKKLIYEYKDMGADREYDAALKGILDILEKASATNDASKMRKILEPLIASGDGFLDSALQFEQYRKYFHKKKKKVSLQRNGLLWWTFMRLAKFSYANEAMEDIIDATSHLAKGLTEEDFQKMSDKQEKENEELFK